MNKKEIKQLEAKIEEVTGMKNVEIVVNNVVFLDRVENPSVDMRILEIENKTNALLKTKTLRELRQEKKHKLLKGIGNLFNKAVDKIDDPDFSLADVKPIKPIVDYFFGYEEYEIVGNYDHQKEDTVQEGNVVYLNNDFKELEKLK